MKFAKVQYKVAYDEFFSYDDIPVQKQYFDTSHKRCHEPMNQLIRRYNLHNKYILSIGTGVGFQEYCFYEHGCSLTCCDIDEDRIIEPHLKSLKEGSLCYIIGDAAELNLSKTFDVVYFSGFAPNELRNAKIYSASNKINKKLLCGWPASEKPFIDIVMGIADRMVKNGGLFIYQSYGSGVDVRDKNYLLGIKHQLDEIGFKLADVYYFDGYPSVHLIVAARGNADYSNNPEISLFHGRGMAGVHFKGIKKL